MVNNSSGHRVLVIDDERLIRWSLAETLVDQGYDVAQAGDGATAVEALSEGHLPPDVVLLDFRLPDSNDLGLLSKIRRLAPRAQIILMTAYGTPEVLRGADELGAYQVLTKPFEINEVPALVSEALKTRPSWPRGLSRPA